MYPWCTSISYNWKLIRRCPIRDYHYHSLLRKPVSRERERIRFMVEKKSSNFTIRIFSLIESYSILWFNEGMGIIESRINLLNFNFVVRFIFFFFFETSAEQNGKIFSTLLFIINFSKCWKQMFFNIRGWCGNGEDVYRSHNSRSNRLAAAWECIGKICLTAAATGVGRGGEEKPLGPATIPLDRSGKRYQETLFAGEARKAEETGGQWRNWNGGIKGRNGNEKRSKRKQRRARGSRGWGM